MFLLEKLENRGHCDQIATKPKIKLSVKLSGKKASYILYS